MATSANLKRAVKRIKATLNANYEAAQVTPTAGPVGTGKAFIGGQVFDGNISGVTQVVNVGRPAAAQYAAKVGGGVAVASSGGGGSTSSGGGTGAAITSSFVIADPDALLPNARLLAVSAALSLTDAGAGGAVTIGMATPPTLSATSTNDATTGSHAIAASAAPGTTESILKAVSGLVTLPQFTATTKVVAPRIDTASGTLSLQPAGTTVQAVGAFRSTYNGTDSGGAVVQSILDAGSSYARAWFGHNAKYDLSGDIWDIDNIGTNDASGLLLRNNAAAIDFIFHNSSGASSRTMDHSTFTAGTKFTMTSAGRFGVLNTSPSYELDVTGTGRLTTSLTTPLITTGTNVDLVINPAGTGAVQFPNDQKLRTSTFDGWAIPYTTGFQINEFEPVPGGSASVLTIGRIQADELDVRVFVANETRVSRGDEFWTKSFGILAESFTTPGSIGGTVSVKFEDSPAITGAIFVNSDWVLIRKLEIDTGASLYNVWGQVATYINNGDGTQNWTFTLRGGPTNKLIDRGSLGIDFGQVGAALIHLSVVDASGSPYIKLRKWVSGSDPMTITGPNFKTYVQIGELGSISNSYYTPSGFGWYVQSSTSDARFIVADDNGLQIRGASFKMYDGSLQTVDISSTDGSMKLGTDVSGSATTALDFDASTGDLTITGDLYTDKVYLLRASGLNTEQDTWGSWDNRRAMQWWPSLASMSGDPSLSMYTGKHSGGSFPNQNWAYIDSNPTGGVLANLSITAHGQGTADDASIYIEGGSQSLASPATIVITADSIDLSGSVDAVSLAVGGTAVSLSGHTHSYLPLSGGTLTGTVITDVLRPATNNTKTVGTASYYYDAGYFDQIFVNEIVGTPTYSHTHSASEITSGTLDFARMATTWNGALTLDADTGLTSNYVRWLTQTATGKAWDLIGRAHDYATTPAQQNDLLLTYYDGSSTYIVWQADSSTRVVDFLNTPTVGGTALVPGGRTVSAGSGLTGGGALSGNITISHDDTSTQSSVNNSGTTFIQDVTLDTYGHVTALGSVDMGTALDSRYVNTDGDTMTGTLTVAGGSLISLLSGSTGGTIVQGILDADTSYARSWFGHNAEWDGTGNLWNIDAIGTNDAAGFLISNSSAAIQFVFHASTGNTSRTMDHTTFTAGTKFTMTSAGRFGVLNTSPSYEVDATGSIRATVSVLTPTVTTSSGNLSLTSAGGTVAVTGALTASSTVAVTTSVSAPSLITASGNLSINPAGGTTAITGALTGSSTAAFTTSVSTPTVTTASGNLTLTSAGGTVAVTGALTGSSTGVFTSTLTAASDTDAINTFGRVRLGYAAATDTASFSHFDQNTSTNFALSQSAAGATIVNAVSGQTLSLSNAGIATATVSASGIDLQSGKYIGSYDYASQSAGWRVDSLGGADFRYLYADQLHVKSFIADLEQALAGGQIISKSVAVLASDFVAPYAGGTQLLTVEDLPSASNMAVFEANDIVLMRQMSRAGGTLSVGYCWGAVTGYTDGTGTQTWTFTRSGTTTYNNITQRGTATSNSTSSGTSTTVTKPTGVVSGDVMLAVVTHDGSADTITATGWTIIGAYTSGTDINFAMYYRVAGGAEGSNYSFSTVSSHALAASIVAYYNVTTSPVFDDYSISTNSASTSMTGTTVFGTATANMLVFLGGITNNSASTPPSGMTELIDAGSSGIRVYVAHQTLAASGETGSKVATISASHASIVGMVALRPTYSAMSAEAGTVTPGSTIEADGLVLDYGVSGNGVYEVNAIDGTYGANSPYAQVYTWTTHPATGSVVRTRMGNLVGISGASAGEYGLYAGDGAIATTSQYMRISTAGVQLNNIPIKLYNAGTQTVNIDSAGTDIWVGTSSSDKRLQWNGTSLNLNNSAGTAVITFDNSGGSYFAGAMTIGGSGGIYQGSGTFASPTTGLKIWNDTSVGRIGGYNGGTLQWYANTDGKMYAGAGNVVLDSAGISVIGGSSFIIKQDSSTTKGYIYSSNPLDSLLVSNTGVGIKTAAAATTESISLRANASGGRTSEIAIEATGSSGTNRVRILAYSGNTSTSGQLTLGEASFALALNGTGTDDFIIDGTSARFNTDVDLNNNDLIDVATLGVGTSSPDALQVNSEVTETARGVDNIRLGVAGGSPRIMLEDATYTQWGVDNYFGTFRIFNPGAVKMSIDTSGNVALTGDLDLNGNDIVDIGTIGDVSTWTPGITFGGGSTGLTYSSRTGRYVKMGKLVYASCEIRLSAKGSSTGSAKITGLPATAATTAAGGVPSIIWYQMASNFVHVSGGVDTGGTAITLVGYTAAAASYAALTHADFANNSILQMTVMYEAA